ncbi:MAG: hypothetical protein SOX38_09375 [Candidatus Limiplasma sp.]|nr:hypothetical protein [Candidatus Limiplasma sp.]
MAEETEKTAFEQAEDIPQTAETEKQRKSEEKKRQKAEKRAAKAARRIEKEQARRERSVRKQAEKTARTPHLRERELFELWINGFEKEHQTLLREYFDGLNAHLSLARDEMIQFRRDFAAAIDLLLRLGCPLEEALNRLSPERLGGFYAWPATLWFRLDDAAKIYPLSMKHGQMSVFRLAAVMKEPVKPELLQIALHFTIQRFPGFATTVRKGFFWHYLDQTKRRYCIQPETDIPVRPLKIAASGSQSFRVLYYENRISVEFFHILTDATGGMCFLKTLLAEYLRLLGVGCPCGDGILDVSKPPLAGENENAFPAADRRGKGSGLTDRASLQLSGKLAPVRPCRILHFEMDAEKLREAAKSRNATVTAYLLGLLFLAGRRATEAMGGSFNIQVPVNMRKFYPSPTLRNFSMYCGIRLNLEQVTTLDDILPEIQRQLTEKTSREAMTEMIHSSTRLVNSVRFVPLFIKAPIARLIYGFLGDKIFSNTLSNLGVVHLPPEMESRVDHLEFLLGTLVSNRAGCALVTCGGKAVLTIAKQTADPSLEEALCRLLDEDAVQYAVKGSVLYEG